jgi:histidinol phosphatase-like PHP family hydrolase
MLQTMGTEWARNLIHPDFWLLLAEDRIKKMPNSDIVFTDVRFENEAALIRKYGKLVHIHGRETDLKKEAQGHASEKGVFFVEGTDYRVFNTGSLKDLYETFGVIFKHD